MKKKNHLTALLILLGIGLISTLVWSLNESIAETPRAYGGIQFTITIDTKGDATDLVMDVSDNDVSENMMPWFEALSYSLLYAYVFLGVGYFIAKNIKGHTHAHINGT